MDNYFCSIKKNRTVILLFLISLIIRVPFVFYPNYMADDADYMSIARNINSGDGFVTDIRIQYFSGNENIIHEECERPPLYPLFLSLIFLIRDSVSLGVAANILISSLFISTYFVLFRRLFGQTISIVSAIIVMIDPVFNIVSTSLMTEPLFCLLMIAALWFSIYSKSDKGIIISGIFAGLASLTRYEGLGLVLSIVLWMLLKKEFKKASLFILVTILVISPWLVRNYIVFGNPTYTSYMYIFDSKNIVISAYNSYTPSYITSPGIYSILFFILERAYLYITNFIIFLPIVTPFMFIGCLIFLDNDKLLPVIMTCLSFLIIGLLTFGNAPMMRFIGSMSILAIPMGVATIFMFTEMFSKRGLFPSIDYRLVIALVMIFILMNHFYRSKDAFLSFDRPKFSDEEIGAYNYLLEQKRNGKVVAASEPLGVYYNTGFVSALLPNLNRTELDGFIRKHGVDFIVFNDYSYDKEKVYTTDVMRSLCCDEAITNIMLDHNNISPVYDRGSVRVYRIR